MHKSTLLVTLIIAFVSFGICCNEFEWKCNSDQCVDIDVLCDGNTDCNDGSDETYDVCNTQACPGYAFRCGYGACVSQTARCDNIKDCADNSDEAGCHTGRMKRAYFEQKER